MVFDSPHASRARGLVVVAITVTTTSCVLGPPRIELPVPIAPIGGSRPVTPAGIHLQGELGDGLWGRAQRRVELGSVGLGGSVGDRFELGVTTYSVTREDGAPEPVGIRAKVRLADLESGFASIGLHLSRVHASLEDEAGRDEQMTALDVAIPFTFYPLAGPTGGASHALELYGAPRVVFESFEDRVSGESEKGKLLSLALGVTGRWRYFSATGELNFAHTPSLGLQAIGIRPGFIVLPLLRASLFLPL